ncbi:phage antirepressor N-terminal domain-containing protein [Stenotrophomonas sp. C4297]|uniref:phage antirepressor N-terminal domain-containing protein n=1 Tax=Stenotrophomonas sp. C4297 TaxID=3077847 RepID=UPI00293CA1EE|nr:phage antirepressor N-terminal domain-containing protein [Stenotrophomonas sp. C4297]MDV3510922.1 phage antirepressor N-terminal domain-containing protein [Stenotrophomonas sp. C4297]
MATGIVHVEFHGAELIGRLHQGQPFVAMRPIVEAMGLDWSKQLDKLKSHPVLARQLSTLRGMVAGDGKGRQMQVLPLSRLPFWLATVNPNKVKAAIRERVILFQEQAADALAAAFLSNGARQDAAMAKRVAGTVMCRILHDTLVGLGKDPKGYDYATEHRLVNHCITGVFQGVSEDSLSTDQLKLQQELRMQNAVWIGQGMAYRDRKPLLEQHAATWCRTQHIGLEASNGH